MDAETLKLIAGPVGAVVVLALISWRLWGRNEKLTDDIIQMTKDGTKQDADTASALRELAALIRGRAS